MTKDRKNTAEKNSLFLIKNCNLLIPRPPQKTSKLQEKPSALKREHPALQNDFLNLFSIFEGHFFLPESATLAGTTLTIKTLKFYLLGDPIWVRHGPEEAFGYLQLPFSQV